MPRCRGKKLVVKTDKRNRKTENENERGMGSWTKRHKEVSSAPTKTTPESSQSPEQEGSRSEQHSPPPPTSEPPVSDLIY